MSQTTGFAATAPAAARMASGEPIEAASSSYVVLPPVGRGTVGTGVAVAVPDGYAAFVHPRSGLASRHGITVVNAPGTVDAGYRGEVRVVLLNTDPAEPFTVRRGDRIAQLVVQPVTQVRFLDVAELPATPRGEGGFGSTGR